MGSSILGSEGVLMMPKWEIEWKSKGKTVKNSYRNTFTTSVRELKEIEYAGVLVYDTVTIKFVKGEREYVKN